MSDTDDPRGWIARWPKDSISAVEAWKSVHERFGFAAQAGCELETALVMLVSQSQRDTDNLVSFNALLEYLEVNGSLTLGRLVKIIARLYKLPPELMTSLEIAVKRRNYLIHHLYRHKNSQFQTPSGCEQLVDEIVGIQDDMSDALEQLASWRDNVFGARYDDDIWDEIRDNVQKWRQENQAMLDAMLGGKDAI